MTRRVVSPPLPQQAAALPRPLVVAARLPPPPQPRDASLRIPGGGHLMAAARVPGVLSTRSADAPQSPGDHVLTVAPRQTNIPPMQITTRSLAGLMAAALGSFVAGAGSLNAQGAPVPVASWLTDGGDAQRTGWQQ